MFGIFQCILRKDGGISLPERMRAELEGKPLCGWVNQDEGRTVRVRFPNRAETVSMTVQELRRDAEAGEYLVILQGDLIDSYLLTSRVQACELIVATYQGLRVPKSAIRYEDGVPGVYVVLVDKMYFRRINVIYETAEYVVSSDSWTPEEGAALKLYDTVIVEGVGLYNQKDV